MYINVSNSVDNKHRIDSLREAMGDYPSSRIINCLTFILSTSRIDMNVGKWRASSRIESRTLLAFDEDKKIRTATTTKRRRIRGSYIIVVLP